MDRFTESNELSCVMDSVDISLAELNCINSEANSVQYTNPETIVNHHDGDNGNCSLSDQSTKMTPEQITFSKIDPTVFNKSLYGTSLDPALLTVSSLEDYSDVSSCSETDFGHILNVLEKNPDHFSEFQNAENSKNNSELEKTFDHPGSNNALATSDKTSEKQDCVSRASSETEGEGRCGSVDVIDVNNKDERSTLNLDHQNLNLGTPKSENECTLKTKEQMKEEFLIQSTDHGATKCSENCKDTAKISSFFALDLMGAKQSIEDNEKNAVSTESPSVQNECQLKGMNTGYEVENNTPEYELGHDVETSHEHDRTVSSQESEHSSFEFLKSCLGLSSLDNTKVNQNAEDVLSGNKTKCSQNSEGNYTHPPVLVETTLESVPTGLIQEAKDGGLKHLITDASSSATLSQDFQQQDDSIEAQVSKSLARTESAYDAKDKKSDSLLSSSKLMRKLQPVVLVKTAQQNVKDGNMFICSLCQNNMQTLDKLIEHHHCEHSKHAFQYCLTCRTYFSTKTLAAQHLCEQNNLQLCHTILSTPKQLTEKPHTNYLCKYCQKPFIKWSYFQKHEQRHVTVTAHRCDCCGLYFPHAKRVADHKQKVKCLPLILEPNEEKEKNSEKDPKSPAKPTLTFGIDGCQMGMHDCFVKLVDIKERPSPQNISCSLCGKGFKLRAQLKVHLRSHTGAKPFECSKCKKVFKYSWNLDKHKKELCSGGTAKHITKPSTSSRSPGIFSCPTCPQSFRYSYNRIRHMRKRCLKEYMQMCKGKVGNVYKCPMCPEKFSLVSNRNRHIKKSCFEQYKLQRKTSNKVEEELKEENEEKHVLPTDYLPSYKCKVCPALFAHKSGVYRHMKKHSLPQQTTVQMDNPTDEKKTGPKNEAPPTKECLSPNSSDVTNPENLCRFCDKIFTSSNLLKSHLQLHAGKKPFHCLECGKNFGRRGHLVAHKNVHKRKIQCSVCKKNLPTLGDLLKHRQSHIKKGLLQCPDCPMQFKLPGFLLRHVASHVKKEAMAKSSKQHADGVDGRIDESSFKCGICQKTFVDSKAMSEHCLTHLPTPSICTCPVCNHNFTCRTGLIRHLRLHTGEKPFPCETCGKRFHRKEHLRLHEVKCKGSCEKPATAQTQQKCKVKAVSKAEKIPKQFRCSYCPHIFTMSGNLIMHERAHLANNLLPCLKCGKYYKKKKIYGHRQHCTIKESTTGETFNSEETGVVSECKGTNLVVRKRTCKISNEIKTNIKDSFKERCPHCSKRFQFRSYLLRHIRSHLGKQQFACKHCNQKYVDKISCQQHEALCNAVLQQDKLKTPNESTESTTIPDAQSAASLKECTVVITQNSEQLKCNFCTKTFTKPRYLRRHILTHTEVKPYSCKTCENSFSRYDHLMHHQTRCRGKKQQQLVEEQSIEEEHQVGSQANVLKCNICSKKFSSHRNLMWHISMSHSTVKPFSCLRCGTGFTSKDSLKRHSIRVKCKMSSVECLEPVQSLTNISVQSCRETSKLLQRIEGHYSNKWKFPCKYCPRRFKNQAQLIVHTRLHTGEKPFGCASCDERFIRSDYLKRHLSKCTGKRQGAKVLCEQCGGLFTQEALEIHQNNCLISLKSLDNPENQKSISSPSNVKVFSCVRCNRRFLLFSQLQQHILTDHRSDRLEESGILEHEKLSRNLPIKEETFEDNYAVNLQCSPHTYANNGHENTDPKTESSFECEQCNMRFVTNSGLSMHMCSQTTTCPKCNKAFCSKNVYERHIRKCKGLDLESTLNDEVIVFNKGSNTTGTGVLQTKFSCKDQGKANADKGNAVHKYQCSECEQSFTDGLMLISHLEDHGREDQERRLGKSHRCHICGKTFEQAGVLQRHVKTQHQETLTNTCPECSKNFRTPSDLDIHRSCHDPNRPFVCSTCKLRFWTPKSLSTHQRLSHSSNEPLKTFEPTMKTDALTPKLFTCYPCNKIYSIKKSYMEHCRLKHRSRSASHDEPKSATIEQALSNNESDGNDADDKDVGDDDSDSAPYFPCHVCGKTFLTSENLEDHQRCHLGEKPYECEECGKCFVQLVNLQQHQRSHKSEFQCQMCGKGFVSLFALRKHKHTHLRKRPHRCTKCHLSFTKSSELAEHMVTHRDENFPCDLCHEIFSCKSSRAEHRKIHTEADDLPPLIPPAKQTISSPPVLSSPLLGTVQQYKYRCEICQVRFPDPEQLSEHGCSPAKERPYSCKDCNKHFLHGAHLKKHQLTHQLSGTRSFQCNSCHMSFSHRHHFLTHLQTHGGEEASSSQTNKVKLLNTDDLNQDKIYSCPICPESFSQVLELANHLSVHANMCNVCNKTFSTKQQLEKHEQSHLSAATQYECTECGKNFLGSDAFRQHSCVYQKHLSSSPPDKRRCLKSYSESFTNEEEEVDVGEDFYNCRICNKRFPSNVILKEHEKLHEMVRPFKCLVCGKSFARKKYLTRHQNIHKKMSHQCDLCSKSFKTGQSLLAHRKTHDADHKYCCSVCDKSYKSQYDLSLHEQRHPEFQNFTRVTGNHRCDMCYKSFGLLSQLRKHQETHVGQVVYECTECDKAFAFLHLLEEHQQTHNISTDSSQSRLSPDIVFQSPVME